MRTHVTVSPSLRLRVHSANYRADLPIPTGAIPPRACFELRRRGQDDMGLRCDTMVITLDLQHQSLNINVMVSEANHLADSAVKCSEIPPGACPELRRRGQDDMGVRWSTLLRHCHAARCLPPVRMTWGCGVVRCCCSSTATHRKNQ
jgi:hypothetical protein